MYMSRLPLRIRLIKLVQLELDMGLSEYFQFIDTQLVLEHRVDTYFIFYVARLTQIITKLSTSTASDLFSSSCFLTRRHYRQLNQLFNFAPWAIEKVTRNVQLSSQRWVRKQNGYPDNWVIDLFFFFGTLNIKIRWGAFVTLLLLHFCKCSHDVI